MATVENEKNTPNAGGPVAGDIREVSAEQAVGNDDLAGWIFTIDGCGGIPKGGGVIMHVPVGDREEFEQFLMDSGAFEHVCPDRCAEDYTLMGCSEDLMLRSVTGERTQVHGIREVDYNG